MRMVPPRKNPYYSNLFASTKWTIGAEAGNVIRATAQAQHPDIAEVVAGRSCLRVWLSDAADGSGVVAVAPSGGVAAAIGVVIAAITAGKVIEVLTDATGKFALDITEAGVKTLYVAVALPDGSVAVSPAVTFA